MTKFEEAKAKRRAERIAAANANSEALADNSKYIDYVLDLEEEEVAVTKLQTMMDKLNTLETIVTTDGNKYSVNCYALPEYIFGAVASRLLAIISITGAMFTEERKVAYSAITGISYLTMYKASNALGAPAYYNKGVVADAREYSYESLTLALTHIAEELGVKVSVTKEQLDRWFTNAELKAVTKLEAFTKSALLDNDKSFTIED